MTRKAKTTMMELWTNISKFIYETQQKIYSYIPWTFLGYCSIIVFISIDSRKKRDGKWGKGVKYIPSWHCSMKVQILFRNQPKLQILVPLICQVWKRSEKVLNKWLYKLLEYLKLVSDLACMDLLVNFLHPKQKKNHTHWLKWVPSNFVPRRSDVLGWTRHEHLQFLLLTPLPNFKASSLQKSLELDESVGNRKDTIPFWGGSTGWY